MNRKQTITAILLVVAGVMLGWYGLLTWQFAQKLSIVEKETNEISGRITQLENVLNQLYNPNQEGAGQDNNQ